MASVTGTKRLLGRGLGAKPGGAEGRRRQGKGQQCRPAHRRTPAARSRSRLVGRGRRFSVHWELPDGVGVQHRSAGPVEPSAGTATIRGMSAETAHALVAGASRIVGFTGAGISTESGVPDFRSPDGVWAQNRTVDFREFISSEDGRVEYWRQKVAGWPAMREAQPNAGHYAFVDLDRQGRLDALITPEHRAAAPSGRDCRPTGSWSCTARRRRRSASRAATGSCPTRRAGASRAARRRRAAGAAAGS